MGGEDVLLEMRPGGWRGALDGQRVGGKAMSLARLLALGLPVPRAWVIPSEWLDAHIRALGVDPLARVVEQQLQQGDHRAAEVAARLLRASVQENPLPGALDGAVAALLAALPAGTSLAVRSSATVEATSGASFAGQFETYLGVASAEEARSAVRACWASLWLPRVLRYRGSLQDQERPEPAPRMGVVLQLLVAAEAAGAARADSAAAEVEAVYGLGAGLMAGVVVPDRFRVSRAGMVTAEMIGTKRVRAEAASGNVAWQPIAAGDRDSPCLDHEGACAVAGLAFRVSDAEGTPIVIEWAVAQGTIWALQWQPSAPLDTERGPQARGALRGIPAAPGEAVGRVRIVHAPGDLVDASPGDVIVARYFAPQLAPGFHGGAIVTEAGGTCSHGAVIARERGIPVVVSVAGATQRLQPGAVVRVDGVAGTVTPVSDRGYAASVEPGPAWGVHRDGERGEPVAPDTGAV